MKQIPLDLSLFRWIESETSASDRQALLSIREAVCSVAGSYRYLEVGSHLGGSLQPHVVDTRCVNIFSIDPRPFEQPDERSTSKYRYEENSTDRMLNLLSSIPGANISKIQTFETSSWELTADSIPAPVDFAFIDGEHTNVAALKDFISVRRFLSPIAIVAFHDCCITPGALLKISRSLKSEGQSNGFKYFPRSNVAAITFGSKILSAALLDYGWQEGLSKPHWHSIKLILIRRFPRIMAVLQRCKDYLIDGMPLSTKGNTDVA